MDTWGIYVTIFGVRVEIAEFTNREDAEKALEYLKENYQGEIELVPEHVFESFDEFKKMAEEIAKTE